MSLLFGNEFPTSSRAVDDDDDDDDDFQNIQNESSPVILRWSPSITENIKCSSLTIAIGQAATGFVSIYLLDAQPSERIGVLSSGLGSGDVCSLGQTGSLDRTCFVHRLVDHPDVLFVQCNVDVSPEQSFSWTQQLFSALSLATSHVTVLTSLNVSSYKSALPSGDLPRNFLRTLETDVASSAAVCPYLEQPNTVAGLAAQILTYSQIHHIACSLFVSYTDAHQVEVETIKSFAKLLQTPSLKKLIKANPDVTKKLVSFVRQHQTQSMLYI